MVKFILLELELLPDAPLKTLRCCVFIQLKAVKSEFLSTVEAQKDVERCTHGTGILLLDAESKVKDTHLEIERLEEQKNQLKAIVKDIEDVIRAKDEEFQILELKIEQATHWYVQSFMELVF